jgi:hypothetical protein
MGWDGMVWVLEAEEEEEEMGEKVEEEEKVEVAWWGCDMRL